VGYSLWVVNPTAGDGLARRVWQRLQQTLVQKDVPHKVIVSPRAGAISELVRDMVTDDMPERVVAVGGDGTASEAVNGFLPGDIAFGIIPAGSGNDFARLHRLPTDPDKALDVCLNGQLKKVDIATINDHYLLNVGGVGFDAEVAAETNRIGKKLGSTLPYVISLFRTLFTYRNARIRVEVDGEEIQATSLLVAVGNGQYYGGGMHILPPADTEDGLMDICIGGDLTKVETVKLLPRIFAGTHLSHPKVTMRRGRRVTISSDRPLHFHADGEPLGTTPVTFEVQPAKLSLLV